MKTKFLLIALVSTALLMAMFSSSVLAGNIDPDNDGSQYCWGENA